MKSTLMIKDLTLDKELDSKEMTAVRGGINVNARNLNLANGGGFASPAVVVAPVAQVTPPWGGANFNLLNANVANGGGFASPAAVVAPVTQV